MGRLALLILASGVISLFPYKSARFHVEAEPHCLPGAYCDSVAICVAGWNDTDSLLDMYCALDVSWYYRPSDSLRQSRPGCTDSVALAAEMLASRADLAGPYGADSAFVGRRVRIAARAAIRDTLWLASRGSRFISTPGILIGEVRVWSAEPGSRWRDARLLGSAQVRIRVPRGL